MKFTKENSGYICHRCFYMSFGTYEMNKHCNKKKICKSAYNCLYNDEEYKELSVKKRYYFNDKNIDISKEDTLSIKQKIILVTKYNEELNIIDYNLLNENKEIIKIDNQIEINKKDEINEDIEEIISEDKYVVYIDGMRRFMCPRCKTKYKRKENLYEHLGNTKNCDTKFKFNQLMLNKLKKKEEEEKILIQNQTNNQVNIQNIQNNNNNTQNNNYNVKLRDFVEDAYVYKHIPRDYILQDDFYLYKNFLTMIMENDENKNIYFDGKYAYLYIDGSLKQVQNDKAGCLVLEKLSVAMRSYINSNPKSGKEEEYNHIHKYYSTIRNKYVADTLYKPYDLETNKFLYCETNNIRTRDKCLSDITQVINVHKDKTKKIMEEKECNKYEVDSNYQINIPFYESSRMRNKAFLDNQKYY